MTQTSDAFGSLTALFTSDPAGGAAAGDGRVSVAAPVVVALVGNLPVMAGLWTTQLADEIARHGGPTALVRFERGEVTVELLRAEGRHLPPPAAEAVSRWLPRGASTARRWVVCVPVETDPNLVLGAGGEIVLMTGADEAAVVHAYHRLKHLADEASNRGEPLGRVGLVVVGAPDDRVDAVATKLGEAARSFLGVEVSVVARLPRLDRVQSSARVTYPADETPAFDEFMRALARARQESASRFDTEPAPAAPVPAGFDEPEPEHVPMASIHAAPAHTSVPAAAPAAPVATAHPARATALPAATPHVGATALPAGTAHSKLLPLLKGIRPLGILCPTVPEVELGMDEAGRLHIVGRPAQLARVRAAHTWARQHRQLLGLAFPEMAQQFTVCERMVLSDARDAIGLHGTGVLLDLLVAVETPAGTFQTIVPLNDPATAG
ncbi:MAG: hypothetical protein U0636_06760 [Phycisphaerales bacterium]